MQNRTLLLARLFFLGAMLAGMATPARAQVPAGVAADTALVWRVVTRDGNEYVGKIVERSAGVIRLETDTIGIVSIPEETIVRMEAVDARRRDSGEIWAENPQSTRYFWGPNGYGLRKGEGYYQNVWIFFNQVSFGLSDFASLGVGIIPIFLWGADDVPIWVTPKLSFPVVPGEFNLGIGALAGTVLGTSVGDEAAGIVYGIGTYGSRDRNISFGLGYGFAGDEWGRHPAITLSAMLRRGKRSYLLFENYFISTGDESVGLAMVGGRYIASRISIDYGGVVPIGSGVDRLIVAPWLALVVPFGR
ncbi:MAG: hypothetical protein SH809_18235 [Rhodothermales bacterium]|nr:hypothetical protein [Rhodothermales bacterium]